MSMYVDSSQKAIHDDTASEISAITAKTTLHTSDVILIEDAEASEAKKKIYLGDFLELITDAVYLRSAGAAASDGAGALTLMRVTLKSVGSASSEGVGSLRCDRPLQSVGAAAGQGKGVLWRPIYLQSVGSIASEGVGDLTVV